MDETDELTKAVRVFGVAAVICWVALAAGIVYAKIVDPSFVGVLVGIGISPASTTLAYIGAKAVDGLNR